MRGYWIACAHSAIFKLHYCAVCRSFKRKVGKQQKGHLPFNILQEKPSFNFYLVDLFVPFVICRKKRDLKRYIFVFPCLCCRSIHAKIVHYLDTDFLLLALRKFIGKRRNFQEVRFDEESSFVGAGTELWKSFQDINYGRTNEYVWMYCSDWITNNGNRHRINMGETAQNYQRCCQALG